MSSASPILTEIKPTCRLLVMDLVRDAGLDVSDWANFRGGKKGAASNPRYCYEWAFVQADKVVLNLGTRRCVPSAAGFLEDYSTQTCPSSVRFIQHDSEEGASGEVS